MKFLHIGIEIASALLKTFLFLIQIFKELIFDLVKVINQLQHSVMINDFSFVFFNCKLQARAFFHYVAIFLG